MHLAQKILLEQKVTVNPIFITFTKNNRFIPLVRIVGIAIENIIFTPWPTMALAALV